MRRLLVLVIAAAAVGLWAAPASAHAGLEAADPADGAILDAAPPAVTLSFTEPPDPEISKIEVLNAAGATVQEGLPRPLSGDRRSLQVALPADLADGVYTVSWTVFSTVDGHRTGGAFAFGVGVTAAEVRVPPDVDTTSTSGPTPLGVSGKALLEVGLALLVAAGALGLVVFGGRVPGGRAVLWGAAAAALGGTAALLVAEAASGDVSLATLLGSDTGEPLIRLAVAVLVTAGAAAFAAGAPGRVPLAVLAAAASAAMLMRAWGGHAGGSLIQVLLQWIHFTAVGLWVGGLALVALRIRGARGDPEVVVVRRFSWLAGWSLLAVVLTGSLRAVNELGGFGQWRRLIEESYGVTLAIKVGLAFALIGLGALNRYRRLPALERGEPDVALGTIVRAEVVLAAGLLALTAVLTSFPPAEADAARPAPPRDVVVTGNDFATTMRVRLTVTPGTVGPNVFRAEVTDFDTGAPLDLRSVSLRFEPLADPSVDPGTLDLERAGDAWEASGPQLALGGPWQVTVIVQGDGVAEELPLELRPRLSQTVSVTRAPGQPDLTTIDVPSGARFQMYLDPQAPGPAQLHFTAFDGAGTELPLAEAAFTGQGPDTPPRRLDAERFGPGHFIVDVALTAGAWTFDVRATTEAGDTLLASFTQTIGGTG